MQNKSLITALATLALCCIVAPACAQDKFPSKAVEFIVPWGPGGGADVLARFVGRAMESRLKTPFPVINIPGAVGAIGVAKMLSAPPDGHTLAVLTADSLAAVATGTANWRLDQTVPLAVLVRQPSGIFVRADSRFKTWADVVKEAGANPGKISVGTTGPGSADDMALSYLSTKRVQLLSVPYPRPAERYTAVLGGHIDLLYEQAGDVKGHLEGHKMRPLLFFSRTRIMPDFADVPVSAEFGYDILLPQFRAIVVRAETDPKRIQILVDALEAYAKSDEYTGFLRDQIALQDSFLPYKNAQAFLRSELEAMRQTSASSPASAK